MTEPEHEDDIRPARQRLFPKLSNETVIALSALLISLCALTVSVLEVRLMYKQQSAMVYPHLELTLNYNAEGFAVIVRNSGNGLAMIRDVRIWTDDTYFENWWEVFDYLLPEGHSIGYDILRHNNFADQVLPANQSITLMGLPWTPETRRLEERLRDFSYRIRYCSVMDECYVIEDGQAGPRPSPRPGRADPSRAFVD